MTITQTITYRVIETLTNDFAVDEGLNVTFVWSGTDLNELSRLYPPSPVFGADPLGHFEVEDGMIRRSCHFERQIGDGPWEEIDDPRRRITPMTELERAIDAENRRLYPGDFITDDEDEDPYPYDEDPYEDLEPDCIVCGDQGCEVCAPITYPTMADCNGCGRRYDVDEFTEEDGLCNDCENDRLEELKPKCSDCDSVTVENQGDVCKYCQQWRDDDVRWRRVLRKLKLLPLK